MEKITITFLGTGNAVPTEKRNHTAMLLTYKNENLLIDCGEGTQRQFRYAKLSPSKLTRVLITHWHGDHILGLPGLFQTLAMNDYRRTLYVYGPRKTLNYLQLLGELVTIKTDIKAKEVISGTVFEEEDYKVEAIGLDHGTPALAYAFIVKEKRRLDRAKLKKLKLPNTPLLGQLAAGKDITIEGKKIKAKDVSYIEPEKRIVFVLDTAMTQNAIEIAKNADILICESSFSSEETAQAEEYKHLTAIDAATIAKKAKVKELVLTHISQRYEHMPQIILDEAKKVFRNTRIVKDLDVVEV